MFLSFDVVRLLVCFLESLVVFHESDMHGCHMQLAQTLQTESTQKALLDRNADKLVKMLRLVTRKRRSINISQKP